MEILKELFARQFGSSPSRIQPLQAKLGGSGRTIVRLANDTTSAIGILHNVRAENVAFIEFSKHFRRHDLPVPEVYLADLDQGAYLEEDLGDTTLFELLSANRDGDSIAQPAIEAYQKAVTILPRFQVESSRDFNYKVCYPRSSFDRQSIAWDLNYFKYYFMRLAGISFSEQALENDFSALTKILLAAPRDYFLYRDFQSRNIMLRQGEPYFLDYQGGRKGALQYDIASLLFDGKADLPPEIRQQLLEVYLNTLAGFIDLDRDVFVQYYYPFVYVRIMQALGAYGFRGFYERKPHFLQSVPYALKNLRWLMENVHLPIPLPTLTNAFKQMIDSPKLQNIALAAEAPPVPRIEAPISSPQASALTVHVSSFSFHRGGPPKDDSGNGGGFVFDCRSLPNPGREGRFKPLTGKDPAVAEYLDKQESVHKFMASVTALVDASIENYQQRGFKHLSVCFGCTGGQHRSVYFAEQLAKKLRSNGINVDLRHVQLEANCE